LPGFSSPDRRAPARGGFGLQREPSMQDAALSFLSSLHPYDALPEAQRRDIAAKLQPMTLEPEGSVYAAGDRLPGLFIVVDGQICVRDADGAQVSSLGPGNSFGERGLLKDGHAVTSAVATTVTQLYCLPADTSHDLRATAPAFARFFDRDASAPTTPAPNDLTQVTVEALMATNPVTCGPDTSVQDAAARMQERRISCLCVCEGEALVGIVTVRDLAGKALASGLPLDTPVRQIMTPGPRALPPAAIGSDVLHLMMEHRIGHLPVVSAGKLVGMVTQTDLTRFQASTAAGFVADVARAERLEDLAKITARIPQLLVQLVAAGHRHDTVTRMITDIADVVTRRLLAMAEARLGPPPVPYLWLACGSQGRQEMTGVSDQDNCLILADAPDAEGAAYFEALARFVCDGLDACGYIHCPGDMMATNPRWRQPLEVWRGYFQSWIARPDKEAQMLASVMFDLRPIGGETRLFDGLHAETLRRASENSIFTAHMASNALSHQPPLGLLRGLATIRSGEHRDTFDAKLGGVVPVVDLARMYALQGRIEVVNTRARLEAALAQGRVSASGGQDLLKAYDLVAQTRLRHQCARIKEGARPDNFVRPGDLSDFERSHLRNAFVVIKTMQSAMMQGRGMLG
jgi:CBS domain-containing protein